MLSNDSMQKRKNRIKKIFLIIFNIIFFSVTVISVFVCLIKINVINTKMFSPYGNGRKQYELIKDELGEDFSDFTKDDSGIKIYEQNNKISIVKIGDKEYKIE